jgi:pimeloyl-ACP methyl ester carboxylesterase
VTMPPLPAKGSTAWYEWAQATHDAAAAVPGKADLVNGAVPDGQLPARLTDPALRAAFGAADAALAAERVAVAAARFARESPPRWSQADGLAALTSAGLTETGGWIAATTGGTNGDAVFPVWGTRTDLRASFTVKATKTVTGSRSSVGFTVSERGVIPTGTSPSTAGCFHAGYLQGTGIAFIRDNVGGPITILGDASLTDGAEYAVSVAVESSISKASGAASGAVHAVVRDAAGTVLANGVTSFGHSSYTVRNGHIRTNVAAGALRDVRIVNHALGPIDGMTFPELGTPGPTGESALVLLPATPNGRVVYALHGHGGTPTETGWTSTVYRPTWLALTAAGYTVAVPRMGGNLWGNDTALKAVTDLHNTLVTTYDVERDGVYLWGNSMGGGAAATIIAKKLLPVRAAYLAQPAVDYDAIAANASFSTILDAYPSTADRDDNNPLKQPGAAYAGVPLYITASTADTSIAKASNADALAALAGPHTTVRQVAATGNHNDPSHFRAQDTLRWFRSFA